MLTRKQSYLLSLSILAVVIICCLASLYALQIVMHPLAQRINESRQFASTFPFGGATLGSMDNSTFGDIIGFVRRLRLLSTLFILLITLCVGRLLWLWRSQSARISQY